MLPITLIKYQKMDLYSWNLYGARISHSLYHLYQGGPLNLLLYFYIWYGWILNVMSCAIFDFTFIVTSWIYLNPYLHQTHTFTKFTLTQYPWTHLPSFCCTHSDQYIYQWFLEIIFLYFPRKGLVLKWCNTYLERIRVKKSYWDK